jgi:DNA ligase-associated metallophosphoesterase
MQISFFGQTLTLLSDRALLWHERNALLLSDPHFGKGNVFRRQGLAVPRGSTRHDLERVAALVDEWRPKHWWILGDFVHAPPRPDEPWLEYFDEWRKQHAELEVTVVAGNHDRGWRPPSEWHIDWRNKPWQVDNLVLDHEPDPHPAGPVIAGHLHPVLKLKDGRLTLRVPIFLQHPDGLILPSFGSFTGGEPVELGKQEKAWGILGEEVVAL